MTKKEFVGPYTDLSIAQYFEKVVSERPDHDFVVMADRDLRWTYKEFNERVDNLAKGLLLSGIEKGDHVGIWARNVPDWLTYLFATAKIGAVLVTVNPVYKSHELAYVMKQSDMAALVIIDNYRDVDYLQVVRELVPESLTQPRDHLKSEEFPMLKALHYMGPEKYRGFYSMPELLLLGEHAPDDELRKLVDEGDADDVINMQYTSGTTGFPKGVQLTSRNILNNGYYIGERQAFTKDDKVCLPPPLFHCFGLVLGILAILTHQMTVVLVESFDPLVVLAAVEKERCTALYGVPTMFIAELEHPMFDMFDLSSLRTGIMAGSPCPPEVMKDVMEKMHCDEITIAYGLTESSPVFTQTTVDDPFWARIETVGKKMPHLDVKVADPDTGEEVPTGVQGELCVRGYSVMKGYYKMPEQTAEAIDEDGWLHSGDLGYVDEHGYYRITGRIKDMIIRGGENIYPKEIEEFLYTLEGVSDVQVVGAPDEKYGELPAAFIIQKKGANLTEADVQEFCYARMARYKAPKYIFFVDSFPLTASGKIKKYELREMAANWLASGKVTPAPTYKLS